MQASNNGDPRQCAANLLKITQGENPFERIKGIDSALTDATSTSAQYDVVSNIEFVLETYEPRVEVVGIELNNLHAQYGDYSPLVQIKLREEDNNE